MTNNRRLHAAKIARRSRETVHQQHFVDRSTTHPSSGFSASWRIDFAEISCRWDAVKLESKDQGCIAVLLRVRFAINEVRCSQVGYFVVRKKSFKALAREIHFIVLAHLPYFKPALRF